ncbi:hypothetical protein [Pulveribacter suum]|uniref:Uncharacterized protein n=1 Tax=Pulveribacter suum TaxID=2116657 RepID=A0A2P1NM11_9BURK|nr:hypothetical protein [Pulveribacter suum]AVP58037.1 hypothetical protein C7H73_10425 [Pulveribacter suum]
MRMGFGLIALLAALAIVAVLAKKQVKATRVAVPPAVQGAASTPDATVRAQSQQIQQQVREQMDALMQQPRPLPDDAQ